MSAPGIPDLRTLLRSNRPPRRVPGPGPPGRDRGAGSAADDISSHNPSTINNDDDDSYIQPANANTNTKDQIVQQTDRDATLSRVSAVESGYLEDPFARCFLEAGESVERRFPIINRGTYVRTYAVDLLVERFLCCSSEFPGTKKQIISLGAGSDTRWFRLVSARSSPSFTTYPFLSPVAAYPSLSLAAASPPSTSTSETTSTSPEIIYHELDFPHNTSRKIHSIQQSEFLLSTIQQYSSPFNISEDKTQLLSPGYNIHPIDLRTLQPPSSSSSSSSSSPPQIPNLDPTLPTLLISECCLIYLPPSLADSILRYFTTYIFPTSTPLGIILYEPIRPFDAFGEVMQQNLLRRGIVLQTFHKYSSLGKQRERLNLLGFKEGQGAVDVDFVWENWVDPRERERVDRLEGLDEVEEWRLLGRHYCVGWGWRDGEGDGEGGKRKGKGVFGGWVELPRPTGDDE